MSEKKNFTVGFHDSDLSNISHGTYWVEATDKEDALDKAELLFSDQYPEEYKLWNSEGHFSEVKAEDESVYHLYDGESGWSEMN